jgi:hypothetical protein
MFQLNPNLKRKIYEKFLYFRRLKQMLIHFVNASYSEYDSIFKTSVPLCFPRQRRVLDAMAPCKTSE